MAVEGWKNLPLSELAEFSKGKKVDSFEGYVEGALPYIGAASFEGTFKTFTTSPTAVTCNKEDILMLWDGERSGLVTTGYRGAVSSTVVKLTPKKITSGYLYYFLKSKFDWIQSNRTGQAIPHVPKNLKDMLEVPVPPIDEQKKIAEILGSVDEAIVKTEAVIAQTQRVKQGLLQTLLTKGIGHTKFKQTEIGEIPESWEVSALADSLSLLKDGTHLPPKRVDEGPLLLSIQNMIDETLKRTERDTRVPLDFYQQMHKNWKILPGDVLLACVGATIGKTARVPEHFEPFTLQRSVAVLRAKKGVTMNDFVYIFLHSPLFYSQMWSRAKVGAQPGIYLKEIGKIQMPLPPLAEQEKIFSIAKSIVASCSINDERLLALKRIKSGLMSDLLTGRVRVKLDKRSERAA